MNTTELVTREVRGYSEVHVNLTSRAHAAAAPKWGPYGKAEREALQAARARADEEVLQQFWLSEERMGFPVPEVQKQKQRDAMALSGSVGVMGHVACFGPPVVVRQAAPESPAPTTTRHQKRK